MVSNKLGRGGQLDLTNKEFNFFKVIKKVADKLTPNSRIKKHVQWLCKCTCGVEFITTTKQIRKGRKSCGCQSICNRFMKTLEGDQLILNKILSHYYISARKRGIEWQLSKSHSTSLLLGNCKYCGSEPSRVCSYFKGCQPIKVNGIDRVDNEIGYIESNVVTCCQICNRAKLDLTLEEFECWINNLVKHRGVS